MAPTKSAKPARPRYRCGECGLEVPKWVGRCPECQAWGSVTETAAPARSSLNRVAAGAPALPARPIAEVDVEAARARPSGVPELDRVLGGGIVPGAVMLLAGEPGVGKSTLLLEVAHQWAAGPGGPALYITGEESAGQVRLRAERTGNVHESLYVSAESDLSAVLGHVDAVRPGLLIVDSVQTVQSPEVEGSPGGVTQVRAVTVALTALAKERGLPVVLVGHVTKDGSVAGPRVLEHLVDVVLHFEGDRHSTLRLVRGVKNRFGAADEVGCFELRDDGIVGLADPSGLFLNRRETAVAGTAVTVVVEGKRPLLAEVQALVSKSTLAMPRRAVSGLDSARVSMVLAVLERRGRVRLGESDVFTATVGGMKVTEPASDLAVALAVASAASDQPLPPDLAVVGEVGLAGEVRPVVGAGRRFAEAARLGFTRALVPPDSGPLPPELRAVVVPDLRSALAELRRGH
ncbi:MULTISPECIES: DNA repair protein RadA [Actinoalloteichus]|uniref:DNA repair protein RadA n=1 Tax=Actinoalloteichus fjordicus TaxID=1612552 RepID=A0AAC9L8P5_9PSEU|nr:MULTISPECIES: DNA repair protein RadA [Actinoalloteichus]APU12420.1 DNA repair protein RadA [Actinoalloteichus fjordicus]APU18373.1 DNA repair protein RadA [Actinoalloteichus sp. GBA129-24]